MNETMTRKKEGENTMKNELTTEQAKKLLTAKGIKTQWQWRGPEAGKGEAR